MHRNCDIFHISFMEMSHLCLHTLTYFLLFQGHSNDNEKKQILLDNVINLNQSDLENILIALKENIPQAALILAGSYRDLEISLIRKTCSTTPAEPSAPLDVAQPVSNNNPELPPQNDVAVSATIKPYYVGEGVILEPYIKDVTLTRILTVRKSDRFHTSVSNDIETFSMQSRNRGVFFLVNMINFEEEHNERQGALVDKNNLISLYRQMGFTCFYYEDITESVSFLFKTQSFCMKI